MIREQSKHKACRRYGVKLCQSDKCPVTKKNYPPGMHGPKGPRRLTQYGKQLAEKQKARIIYGVREKQFRGYFDKAFRKLGNTAEILFQILESRLDNTVYRLGFAKTRRQARQLVSHAHFLVNGKNVNIPSYQIKVDDVVSLRPKSQKVKAFEGLNERLQEAQKNSMPWLTIDSTKQEGRVTGEPKLGDVEMNVDWRMIIEFYSK